jgi:hypothetical protein
LWGLSALCRRVVAALAVIKHTHVAVRMCIEVVSDDEVL